MGPYASNPKTRLSKLHNFIRKCDAELPTGVGCQS
jgi:hypothetical protein